jgi:hypothetical protein
VEQLRIVGPVRHGLPIDRERLGMAPGIAKRSRQRRLHHR